MAVALKVLGCVFTVVLLARLCFTLLFLLTSLVCLQGGDTTETCGNKTFSQDERNKLDMAGTFVEAGSSILFILVMFSWSRFSVKNFCQAVPSLAVFWLWIAFFIVAIFSTVSMDFMNEKAVLGMSLILEIGSLVLLCCVLKFVHKITVKRSFEKSLPSHKRWPTFLYYLFMATLWTYMLRNLVLFLYDTSVFAKKINRHSHFGHVDGLVLIVNCATRGSFVQSLYAYIFANPRLPMVCDNVESARMRDQYGRIGVRDAMGGFQPVVEWLTEIEETNRFSQSLSSR